MRKMDVLNDICHERFGVWWPQYMAHNAVYGIKDLNEFTDVIYEAMERYSKHNVKAKEKAYKEIIDEMNRIPGYDG